MKKWGLRIIIFISVFLMMIITKRFGIVSAFNQDPAPMDWIYIFDELPTYFIISLVMTILVSLYKWK